MLKRRHNKRDFSAGYPQQWQFSNLSSLRGVLKNSSSGIKNFADIIFEVELIWPVYLFYKMLQKQPPEVFCEKRCSWKFCKIHNKTPVPEALGLQLY